MTKSRRMRWLGHVALGGGGGDENTYKILIGKTDEKRPLRRPRYRCEDNIKMDLKEIGREGVD
jgi:hypothetical protein